MGVLPVLCPVCVRCPSFPLVLSFFFTLLSAASILAPGSFLRVAHPKPARLGLTPYGCAGSGPLGVGLLEGGCAWGMHPPPDLCPLALVGFFRASSGV